MFADAVPAFTAKVAAPTPIVISSPLPDASTHAIIASSSSDLALIWNRASAGELQVKLANKSKVATCTFAATSGGGTIPARALAFLGTGNSSQFSTVLLSSADTTVDRLTVTVNATLNPTFAGGASAASPLVIQ